jgi:hypothetical protein
MYRSKINTLKKCVKLVIKKNYAEMHGQQNIKKVKTSLKTSLRTSLLTQNKKVKYGSYTKIAGHNVAVSLLQCLVVTYLAIFRDVYETLPNTRFESLVA